MPGDVTAFHLSDRVALEVQFQPVRDVVPVTAVGTAVGVTTGIDVAAHVVMRALGGQTTIDLLARMIISDLAKKNIVR